MLTSIGNNSGNIKNVFRITNDTIIRLFDFDEVVPFYLYQSQYVKATLKNWDSSVWVAGPFSKRLNRTYSNTGLLPYPESTQPAERVSTCVEVMLQQGYSFNGVFGFHVILLNSNTGEIFCSQILTEEDFSITSNKLLIDGSFWMQSAKLYIPKVTGVLSAQITEIKFEDISLESDNIGMIYNFPEDFLPLISEKPTTDLIKNKISLDDNFYLNIELTNDDTKSIEQTILDYFDFDFAEITVQHVVNYGNETLGFQEIIVTNNVNKYGNVCVGLNLKPYINQEDQTLQITVTTQFIVNNSLMERIAVINANIDEIMNPLILNKIVHPETNYPVNVEIINKLEQKIIYQNKETKFITIQQPVYAELITDTFKIENKNIVFSNLANPSYLIITKTKGTEEQNISSKILSDGTIYFDISELIPIDENSTYQLIDKESMQIIGNGIVLAK